MGNTRDRMRQVRQKIQDGFRRVFPKPSTLLKKNDPNTIHIMDVQQHIPARPLIGPTTGLSVISTIRFETPLSEVSTQVYRATTKMDGSEEVLQALKERINYCTNEMIDRTDAGAKNMFRHTDPKLKKARYHILYQICWDGKSIWDRMYTSYHHTAVTRDVAKSITSEVDSIIAAFLLHHDEGFEWHADTTPGVHRSTAPEIGQPQDIQCVPDFDAPAFTTDVALRTKINGREHIRNIKIDSSQSTPLTLQLGEEMLSDLSELVNNTKNNLESRFTNNHADCNGLEGRYGCRHVEEGAFELIVKLTNNFGPDYNHLAHRSQSHRRLVHPRDTEEFMLALHKDVENVTAKYDDISTDSEDFTITVHELRSHNWVVRGDPLKVSIDNSVYRNRTTTNKMLQRVQEGMFNVLRGSGTMAIVTAHKRGHLVLDTIICRGEDHPFWDVTMGKYDHLHLKGPALRRQLADRIVKDLSAVCKDTIRLDPSPLVDIKVTHSEELDVVPLTGEAFRVFDKFQQVGTIKGAEPDVDPDMDGQIVDESDADLYEGSLENTEDELREDDDAGNVLGQDFNSMASIVSRDESEPQDHDEATLPDVHFDDGACTPPNTPPRRAETDDDARTPDGTPPQTCRTLFTGTQNNSNDEEPDRWCRTPEGSPRPVCRTLFTPTPNRANHDVLDMPDNGELIQFPNLAIGKVRQGIPRSPATWLLPIDLEESDEASDTRDDAKTEDIVNGADNARDTEAFADSFQYRNPPLSPIMEEDEDDEKAGARVVTIIRTPIRKNDNASSLLASLTDENAKVCELTPRRCGDPNHCPVEDENRDPSQKADSDKTITQERFHQNEKSNAAEPPAPTELKSPGSYDSLYEALLMYRDPEVNDDDQQDQPDKNQCHDDMSSSQHEGAATQNPTVPPPSNEFGVQASASSSSWVTCSDAEGEDQEAQVTAAPNEQTANEQTAPVQLASSQDSETF